MPSLSFHMGFLLNFREKSVMDIMHAIMNIEQKVKAIADSADELIESQNTILNDEIRKKEEEMNIRLAEQSGRIEEEYAYHCEESMQKLERAYAEKLESLDKKCRAGREKWIAEIVFSITEERTDDK